MSTVQFNDRKANRFDALQIDVAELYRRHPYGDKQPSQPGQMEYSRTPFHAFYRNPALPLRLRKAFYRFARRMNLDLSWFTYFNQYWTEVLGGRPLWSVYDLYFLQNIYRMKFQDNEVPDSEDPALHLQAWQQADVLYQLLHLASKDAIYECLPLLQAMNRYKRGARSFLEFGCGTAPITTTLYDFYKPGRDFRVYISDLQSVAFHYAAYKFRSNPNVVPLLLEPAGKFLPQLPGQVDAIFCITVYEHLMDPLEVTQLFHKYLSDKGLLLFDYIKSEGTGLDTKRSLRQRKPVLEFIASNFEVLSGRIDPENSMPLTVVRKK